MRLRSLLVGNKLYAVRYVKEVSLNHEPCDGVCDDGKKLIQIDRNNDERTLLLVLLHELVHAVVKEYRIKIEASQEEELAWGLALTMEGNFEITRKSRRRKA